jgi:hypothetical protein
VACGGGSSSGGNETTTGGPDAGNAPASVNGTIGGQSMSAKDAISGVLALQSNGSVGVVLITTIANTCSEFSGGHGPKSAQAIVIALANVGTSSLSPAQTPGDYTIYDANATNPGPNLAAVAYETTDATCNQTTSLQASSGKVTLTRADSKGYAGTFDVTFPNGGGHVTGEFDTANCSSIAAPSSC